MPHYATKADKRKAAEAAFAYAQIERHKSDMTSVRATWTRYKAAFRGRYYERAHEAAVQDGGALIDQNEDITLESGSAILYGFVDTMLANVIPSNPAVDIHPLRAGLESQAEDRRQLLERVFDEVDVQSILWHAAALTSVCGRSFVKCVWDSKKQMPKLRVIDPSAVFADLGAESWEDVRYVAEATVVTRGELMRRIKRKGVAADRNESEGRYYPHDLDVKKIRFGKYPGWLTETESEDAGLKDAAEIARAGMEWVTVYEYYDFVAKKLYHFADGCPEPLWCDDLPYKRAENPYYLMTFASNLKDLGGLGDAELVYPHLERMNELSTMRMHHAKLSIPDVFYDPESLQDPAAFREIMERPKMPGSMIPMRMRSDRRLSDAIQVRPAPTLTIDFDSAMFDARGAAEFSLGMPAYERGGLGKSDVATELALVDEGYDTRNSRRQKVIYKALEWIAKTCISHLHEFFPEDVRIPVMPTAGEKGAARFVTRESLGLQVEGDSAWTFDYACRPFDATEINSSTLLKQLQTFLDVLMNHPNIDQTVLAKQLADLIHMPELFQEAQQPPMDPAAMGGPPAGGPMGGPPVDPSVGVGAIPDAPGMGPNAGVQGALVGGQVLAGGGAGMIETGMEGGGTTLA